MRGEGGRGGRGHGSPGSACTLAFQTCALSSRLCLVAWLATRLAGHKGPPWLHLTCVPLPRRAAGAPPCASWARWARLGGGRPGGPACLLHSAAPGPGGRPADGAAARAAPPCGRPALLAAAPRHAAPGGRRCRSAGPGTARTPHAHDLRLPCRLPAHRFRWASPSIQRHGGGTTRRALLFYCHCLLEQRQMLLASGTSCCCMHQPPACCWQRNWSRCNPSMLWHPVRPLALRFRRWWATAAARSWTPGGRRSVGLHGDGWQEGWQAAGSNQGVPGWLGPFSAPHPWAIAPQETGMQMITPLPGATPMKAGSGRASACALVAT